MNPAQDSETIHPEELGFTPPTRADRPPRPGGSPPGGGRFLPGTMLAERYRIVSVLGEGGMGEVYRADDLVLGQQVALKFLPEMTMDGAKRHRFFDEVRLARHITHPNVCRIFDVGEAGGLAFISMEYIDGENLATLLRRIGRLPEDKAVAIALDLCEGLEAIHQRDILHRDLKPSNLMIDGRGRARIADFGMAGWAGTETTGGTLSYMAPEQLLRLDVTVQSDLYSLGLVLYELFTGNRVFDGPRQAVLAPDPVPPSRLVKGLDPGVEGAILRCLEKNPRDRLGSARAVASALRQASGAGWRPAPGLEIPHRPHWALEKKIGEGGSGEAWLALHAKTRERRVFKFGAEIAQVRALQREVTLLRLLKEELGDRDDITRVLDWSFEEPPYFVETEYAAYGNLPEWAEAQGGVAAVEPEVRLDLVAKTADALAAAHSVGVLHKDVKPTNVLIARAADGELQVRLSDFGIGSVTERQRLAAAGITALGITERDGKSPHGGTHLYMAPEVLEGKAATVHADVYALGVVLYQMVVGDFARVLTPSWQRDVDDDLLREDIAAAVDGSPDRRLGSARQLARRLRSLGTRRAARRARVRARRLARAGKLALGALAFLTAALVLHTRQVAREQARTKNLARVTLAGEWLAKDPTSAALVLLEVDRPETTAFAAAKMRDVLYEEIARAELRLGEPLLATSLGPEGRRLAVVSEDGKAWLWKVDGSAAPRLLDGHGGPVSGIAFSPDGRLAVTASEDGIARVWDGEDGGDPRRLDGADGPLVAASFSPGGDRVATTLKNGDVHLWTLAAPAASAPAVFRSPHGPVKSARFARDGDRLLFVSERTVEIWDPARAGGPRFVLLQTDRPFISSATLSASGERIAVVYDLRQKVEVWRLDGSADPEAVVRHGGPVSTAVFSPTSDHLLTASEDNTAVLHRPDEIGTTDSHTFLGHRGRVASAYFGPRGARVVTASTDGTARVWNADGTGMPRIFKTQEALIAAYLGPRGEQLVTISREGTLRVWDLTRPRVYLALAHEGPVSDASFSPDGDRILTSSQDGTVRLWNADGTGEPVVLGDLRDVMKVLEASFSKDGRRILAVYEDLTVRLWQADRSERSLFFERHLDASRVSDVAFSPDGDRLMSAPLDEDPRIWHVDSDEDPLVLDGHGGYVEEVTFSPDGGRVASASWDGTVRIWTPGTSSESTVLQHGIRVYAVSFSPRGDRVATASADGRVRIWDVASAEETEVFRHDRLVRAPLFSPDGELVATVSNDGTARVGSAEPAAGRAFFLKGHTNSVVNASFSPDGALIVTASRDGTARVWHSDGTGEAIVLRHDAAVAAASFSPGGDRVVTASEDGTARVWRLLETGELLATIRAATEVCLDPQFRQAVLGDTAEEARRRYERCSS